MTNQHPITPPPELVEHWRHYPMTTDFRALVEKLDYIESFYHTGTNSYHLMSLAIDALAEPLPEPSTLPEPVPIGERLPAPEDLNEHGQCWWFNGSRSWMLLYTYNDGDIKNFPYVGGLTHWLPANAIPTPTTESPLADQTEALTNDN